jgi:hypothetical protein
MIFVIEDWTTLVFQQVNPPDLLEVDSQVVKG